MSADRLARHPEREHVHYTNDPAGKVFHEHPYSDGHPTQYAAAHHPPSDPAAPLLEAVRGAAWEVCQADADREGDYMNDRLESAIAALRAALAPKEANRE